MQLSVRTTEFGGSSHGDGPGDALRRGSRGKRMVARGNCSYSFCVFYTLYTLILVCAFGPSYHEMHAQLNPERRICILGAQCHQIDVFHPAVFNNLLLPCCCMGKNINMKENMRLGTFLHQPPNTHTLKNAFGNQCNCLVEIMEQLCLS